jgi:peptide chain release factor 2
MDFQELKFSLSEMEARLQDIKDNVLFVDNKKNRLNEIDSELSKEEVWSDLELSQKLSKEKTTLEKSIKSFDDVSRKLSDSVVLLEVSIEENDDSSIEDILNEISFLFRTFCKFLGTFVKLILAFSRAFGNLAG